MKKFIIFDLDGTLAESKSPADAEMAALLRDLLGELAGLGDAAEIEAAASEWDCGAARGNARLSASLDLDMIAPTNLPSWRGTRARRIGREPV